MDSPIVTCPACEARNRVARRPGTPRCGACHSPLPQPSAGPIVVTDATFRRLVLEADGPVLLDVWAPWCGPCRMLAPVLDALARRAGTGLAIVKLNADENPETVQALGVQGLPTLLLFRSGRIVARHAGFMAGPALAQWLKTAGVHAEAV